MNTTTPIADLTYRNYDGPRELRRFRFLPIALHGIRVAMRNKGFWFAVFFSFFPYISFMMQMFILSRIPTQRSFDLAGSLATAYGQTWPAFLIALIAGAGSIAADNRANALQVYLARPITKTDYLLGKILGVFIIVFLVVFVPFLLALFYSAFSMGVAKFLQEHGSLFPKAFLLAAVPACVHSCVLVGISAWCRAPWQAGTLYAGIWIFTGAFSTMLADSLSHRLTEQGATTVRYLYLDGIISGLGYHLIGSMPRGFSLGVEPFPQWQVLLVLGIVLCLAGVLLARVRIRAVEVVQG